jgi:Domain of unknown function (DUF5666)
MKTQFKLLLFTVLYGTLAACGGGADSSTNPPPSGAGPQAIVASGPVANFGSIVVNGVRYNTDNASFSVDGLPGTQADIKVGHIVTVTGSVNSDGSTGNASSVSFDDLVKGPVDSIDLGAQRLVVLSQTVIVDAGTSFDDRFSPASLDGVSTNQIVEVSGQFDADGNIVATRIEPKPAGTEFEVHGTVSNLDTVAMRFNLQDLVVDYSAATLDDFPGGQIANGDFVEAKGTSLGGGGELLATKVELESVLPGAGNGDFVEIEGFITRFASPEDFDVSGLPVTTTSATRYEGGGPTDLGLNIKVEVDGVLNDAGVLVASKIDIRRARAVRVTAVVDSANGGSNSLVMLGITVKVDMLTRMEDKTDADVSPFNVADIAAGNYLEVRGTEFPAGSGEILAGRLEREDPDDDTILQGFVESFSEPTIEILGVTIETNGQTVFEDASDNVISSSDFFAQLGQNSLIKAKGAEVSDTTLVAREVEFETEF